jgi:Flp pilus assembly pilin Flp
MIGLLREGNWRRPEVLVLVSSAIPSLALATWLVLLNNFAVEEAGFTAVEIGILQSLREVPGLFGFAAIFLLALAREQRLLYLTLLLLGVGVGVTGLFPSAFGLYAITMLMSFGYHYASVVRNSLTLQWVAKERTPEIMGRSLAAGSAASIAAFGLVWLAFAVFELSFAWLYALGGGLTVLLTLLMWAGFPRFPTPTPQRTTVVLRSRYWLFYALQALGGARRQIFIVFATFLMVEKFGFTVSGMAALFLVTAALNVWVAPRVGRFIGTVGERRALNIEYGGLIVIFVAYALVESATVASALYLLDHLFFALAIAMNTYFQKIADPRDIAATSGVTETMNHLAAVIVPAAFGVLWVVASPAAVFLAGAGLAGVSLVLSLYVPRAPRPGNEVEGVTSAAPPSPPR